MRPSPPSPRPLAIFLAIVAVAATMGLSAATAPALTASASSQQVATFCAKRAARIHRRAAATAARRRCIVRLQRATGRTADTTPPTVSWQVPAASATVKGKLEGPACQAAASDDRGVDRVVMRVDNTTLNTESDAPYNCIFDTTRVANGSHTLTATAYDAAGNSRSASLTINVANVATTTSAPTPSPTPAPSSSPTPSPTTTADTTPPTIAWQVPAAGATVKGKLEGPACQAAASDDRGVDRVVMRVDNTTLNTESDAPYNCIFDTTRVANGSHTLTATAYDAAGNSRSASLTINVANATAASSAPEPAPAPSPPPPPPRAAGAW